MPPLRRVSGFRVDSNTEPKIVGLISDQSKLDEACSKINSRSSSVKFGISKLFSANIPPLTYGKDSNSSSKYRSRSSTGVSRIEKRSIKALRKSRLPKRAR